MQISGLTMAGSRYLPICGPSYQLADRKAAVQRSINLYVQQVGGPGEEPLFTLNRAPGLTEKVDTGSTIRGAYATDTRRFIVSGLSLYERDADATLTLRGTLSVGGLDNYVAMKHGRDQLVLVDGPNGYVFNMNTNVFGQITDPDWRGSNWVDEIDGYFVFADPETDQFYISQIDDASSLDALDFSSADAQPDNIVTHRVLKRELYIFGTRSTEVWIDSAGSDFPFARYNSTPIDIGCVGKRAVIRAADSLIFVGVTDRGQGIVYMMQGHQPQRISNRAIEGLLAQSTDLSEVSMWAYQVDGAEFVGINAPGLETTLVWDAAANQWHERAELVNGDLEPLRISDVNYFGGAHYATGGDTDYLIDKTVNTIAGNAMIRERTWPHLKSVSAEPISFRSLELLCTTGEGGNVTLEVSNDGGYVYGPPLIRSLGAIGRRMQRVRWHFLGTSRDRVFRIRCTDDVEFNIHSATMDAS
jgi:hypothetical protein